MANDGHALIFISHKLHEVLAISQQITVLRDDGRRVDTIPTKAPTKRILAGRDDGWASGCAGI